jgi:hypothetical protein
MVAARAFVREAVVNTCVQGEIAVHVATAILWSRAENRSTRAELRVQS